MYGQYSRAVYDQEQVMMRTVYYQNYKVETLLCLVRNVNNNQNRKMTEFTDFTCLFGPTPCLGTLEQPEQFDVNS